MAVIYLAGGCFWGLEAYLKRIPGVLDTESGYANGKTKNPTYEQVCRENTGHAETVRVEYDDQALPLGFLLRLYFDAIDPLSVNRQGGDAGVQYRTGIYYDGPSDLPVITEAVAALEKRLGKKPAVEVLPLLNYSAAEGYHQDYLDKNPGGYCHIGPALLERAAGAIVDPADYPRRDEAVLSGTLSPLAFAVTQKGATEPPFQNEFWAHREEGVYVDITTGEPLFSSRDKFDSGCGWPSFSKPVDPGALREKPDLSHGRVRTEVKSRAGDAHLGHVFEDGPAELGGLRYCINSAALRFVKKEDMEKQGYGRLLGLFD